MRCAKLQQEILETGYPKACESCNSKYEAISEENRNDNEIARACIAVCMRTAVF
jgi:hypothetical protein